MVARSKSRPSPAKQVRPDTIRPAVRERKRKGGQVSDKYALSPEMIADFDARGMTPEWKREIVYGAGDPAYDVFMREQGFEPVDASRYPDYVAPGTTGAIRRDGLILMERPKELTAEAKEEDRRNARDAVRVKEEQLGTAPKGQLPRQRADGSSTVSVNRTIESGIEIE